MLISRYAVLMTTPVVLVFDFVAAFRPHIPAGYADVFCRQRIDEGRSVAYLEKRLMVAKAFRGVGGLVLGRQGESEQKFGKMRVVVKKMSGKAILT